MAEHPVSCPACGSYHVVPQEFAQHPTINNHYHCNNCGQLFADQPHRK